MKYNEFVNRLKAEIAIVENGLILSQTVDYRRDHVEDEDTCYSGILSIINQAEKEAFERQSFVEGEEECFELNPVPVK